MNIEDISKIKHKSNNSNVDDKKIKYYKFLLTRILISIIIIISTCIFIKIDSDNIYLVEDYVFNDNINFLKIEKIYQSYLGNIIPTENKIQEELVFSSSYINEDNYESYLDGIKISLDNNSFITSLMGGLVVFIGEKDGYGNTLIIQGNDGIDYWYGNITNVEVSLYDYVETNKLLGNSNSNYIYLVLEKDGNYINYANI